MLKFLNFYHNSARTAVKILAMISWGTELHIFGDPFTTVVGYLTCTYFERV
jgi:hypothetical protein